ncbi:phage holin family protein [Methylophilus sp. 14]|uniref:phage holin family protein n=1 Tax=Methylophilus sp. 14 TaxID=2781019 RepID=UPI00188E45B1|nr:phage holin family protein [Methylophilus sp. 14]MBF4989207.1 phage holin family protein [Methylophilus sp. 14]
MWVNLLKFAAVLFLNRKVSALKGSFFNLRHHVADYTEDRAQQLKQDFLEETERLATSMVGMLVVFSMFIFTGLLGLMWLFSLLWEHPHRSLILGLAMLVPTIIGVIAFISVRAIWHKKPLFADSLAMINQDWRLFRKEMAPAEQTDAAAAPDNDGAKPAN